MMKDDNKQLYNFKYQIRTPNKKLLIGELIQKNGAIFLFVKCRGKTDMISIRELDKIINMSYEH